VNRPALALGALASLAGAVLAVPPVAPAPRAHVAAAPAPRPGFEAPVLRNTFDIVVTAPARPVRVRAAVLADGLPPGERWAQRLRTAFEYFDRDGDGYLGAKEVPSVFSDVGVAQLLANGFYQPTPNTAPTLEALDTDKDGRVSPAEFVSYYSRATAQVLSAQPLQPDYTNNAPVTEGLFKLFDKNGDGKLTKDELANVEALIASNDSDEDECLNIQELAPNLFDPRFGGFARPRAVVPSDPNAGATARQPVSIYQPGQIPGLLIQNVIKQYDRDGDFELTQNESGFDTDTFVRLDTDRSGKLSGDELDVWRTGKPDAELTLSFAAKAVNCVVKVADEAVLAARGLKVKPIESGRLVLHVGRQPIDFWAFAPVLQYQQPALKQQYGYLFQQAAGKKEYVEEKDLAGPNAVQFQFVRVMFETADRDANGKLTRAEYDAYFDLQDGFRNMSLSLSPSVQTPSLFQLLDENRDGRLGVRELRTAWTRLQALEGPGATEVTKSVIQPAVTLRLSRTYERLYANQPQQVFNTGNVPVPTKGPLWFRKMDRNGDGDVSRGEFLGTRAEFDATDADRDGLISLSEAEAWDAKTRKDEPKKDEKK
jgi:Ca2+-binding EF-hand superfamily protein